MFVYVGAAGVGIRWTLTGHGALVSFGVKTNANGVACCYYDATGGTPDAPGDEITVTAETYA